jgi:hypothetical protein
VHSSPHINSGDHIKKNEMAGLGARMGRGEVHTGFWCRNLRAGDYL